MAIVPVLVLLDGTKATSGTFYKKIYIPLKFFFNTNLAQALPLCALSKLMK